MGQLCDKGSMGIGADLTNASRETLLMVIAEQQATIAGQQAAIGDLERRVLPGGRPLGMRQQVDA